MCIRDSDGVDLRRLGRHHDDRHGRLRPDLPAHVDARHAGHCLLYTSDAADERSSVDLGGRRIIKKKTTVRTLRLTRK